MANIPRNEEVKHRGDVQNLVTGIILCQSTAFSEEDICACVEANLERSDFAQNGMRQDEIDVKAIVNDTLNTLFVIGCLTYDSKQNKYGLHMSFPAISTKNLYSK